MGAEIISESQGFNMFIFELKEVRKETILPTLFGYAAQTHRENQLLVNL